jgi:hypothetical protein
LHHVDVQYFAANDILTFLQYKNIDISFLFSFGNRCLLTFSTLINSVKDIISLCVVINNTGWFFPVLFIATHGEQMYTIGRNASQTHVLFCDFFKQLIWKSFRNITEV